MNSKLNNLLNSARADDSPDGNKKDGKEKKKKKEDAEKTELEILVERRQNEGRSKAQIWWNLLRESVISAKDAVVAAEVKDVGMTHGIHRDRKLNHTQKLSQVVYIAKDKEYLTCDGTYWRIFLADGRKKDLIDIEEGMNRVIYATQTDQFVGWVHGQENIYLMDKGFIVKSQSEALGKILLGAYNHNTGELITIGPHFITCWAFRYGARHLIARKTTKTNFGEQKMFKMVALEETASRTQRMFCAYGTGVVVYNIFSGLEVARKKELHAQPVTALTFFNPLKYVITAAQDGCIKIWDSDWKVNMVFVGHNDAVNFLQIYPHGPAFISASLDCTIRVWNMDTCDEVDKTAISEPIEGMGTEMNHDIFFTYAGKHVDLWNLQHIFHIHTNIGYRVTNVKVTSHPSFPPRAVVICKDSSVRIICPTNGEVLTTLMLQPSDGLVDAAYAIAENSMFVLLDSGDILKCSTDQNPCRIVQRWSCNSLREMCSCLLVYEYVVDPTAQSSVWSMLKKTVATKSVGNVGSETAERNRTLLLGGRKDGYICVFDWHTGEVTFKVEAHGSKGVLNMIGNSKSDQLISAGMDNIIKVWRLYPFAQEALAPLMSFYCAHTPSFMTTIKSSLGVAFQDPATATFSVVLYTLPDKNRADHKPDDDHMDLITGLTSCPRMKLYASCSMDGTIRIWNEQNVLIRLIKINTIPHSIAFCSPQGDLLVGISNHLFFISHKKYLPQFYIRRQACMRFRAPTDELPIEFDENILSDMNKNDVKRLKNSHASFKFDHFVDILSAEEEEEVMREKKLKEEAFIILDNRENELAQIRDGHLISRNKFKGTNRTKNRAFKQYMNMYYNKPFNRKMIPNDDVEAKRLQVKLEGEEEEEEEEKFRPETAPYGFYAELSEMNKMDEGDASPLHPSYPQTPSGFLPNSVLLKIMYPPPQPPPDSRENTPYKPPELTPQQMAEIESLHSRGGTFRRPSEMDFTSRGVTFAADEHLNRVIEIETTDDEMQGEDEAAMEPAVPFEFDESMRGKMKSGGSEDSRFSLFSTPLSPHKTPNRSRMSRKKTSFVEDDEEDEDDLFGPLSNKSTSLMSKFQEIMDKEPSEGEILPEIPEVSETPEPVKKIDKATETPPVVIKSNMKEQMLKQIPKQIPKEISREVTPVPPPSLPKEPSGPSKPITKLVSRPKPKARTPTPPRSPTPPPPPTPLPNYIKQFVGTEWFDKYFPNCNENDWEETMPKPWTSDTFVNMIVKLLRISEFKHKVHVINAILLVQTEEGLSDSVIHHTVKTLGSVLNHHTTPPSCGVPDQKEFIIRALRALSVFAIKDKEIICEMCVQFLDGDQDCRSSVLEVMSSLGLQDQHRQFQKELDSWDIWSVDEKNPKDELHKMCNQWLDRWMTSYKLRIKDTVEKLNAGHSLQGRLSNRGSIMAGASSRRTSMVPSDTLTSLPRTLDPNTARSGRMSSMSNVTVTLDGLPTGSSIMESVNYIDAVNYFCEMMTEKELEALRRGELLRMKKGDQVVQAKNTVLVLPKIAHKPALVRLGEMHTSKCRPERETNMHTDFHLPTITNRGRHPAPGNLTGFVPSINLPMKPVYLNPFPSAIDALHPRYAQPILITLKSAQKYFIPAMSYVPLEEHQVQSALAIAS